MFSQLASGWLLLDVDASPHHGLSAAVRRGFSRQHGTGGTDGTDRCMIRHLRKEFRTFLPAIHADHASTLPFLPSSISGSCDLSSSMVPLGQSVFGGRGACGSVGARARDTLCRNSWEQGRHWACCAVHGCSGWRRMGHWKAAQQEDPAEKRNS